MKGNHKMVIVSSDTVRNSDALTDWQEDALQAAFDAHWSWVCSTMYRVLGDGDEAEDLALEVFYRLYKRPPRNREDLRPWLYRVAVRTGLNALRARRRRRRYEREAELERWEQTPPANPESEVERNQTWQQVRQVLAQIQPRAAELLILRSSGLSYAEIAPILRVAPGSVGKLIARAEQAFERRYRALEGRHETP